MKPLSKKQFNLKFFSPHYVEVTLWATKAELNSYFEKHFTVSTDVKREGEALGFHIPSEIYENAETAAKKVSKRISKIHFTLEHWGFEIITHELMHLVWHMIWGFGISALTSMELEEKWCYTIGELSEQIAKWIHEFDS